MNIDVLAWSASDEVSSKGGIRTERLIVSDSDLDGNSKDLETGVMSNFARKDR